MSVCAHLEAPALRRWARGTRRRRRTRRNLLAVLPRNSYFIRKVAQRISRKHDEGEGGIRIARKRRKKEVGKLRGEGVEESKKERERERERPTVWCDVVCHNVEKRGKGSLRPRGRSGKLTDLGGHSSRARTSAALISALTSRL